MFQNFPHKGCPGRVARTYVGYRLVCPGEVHGGSALVGQLKLKWTSAGHLCSQCKERSGKIVDANWVSSVSLHSENPVETIEAEVGATLSVLGYLMQGFSYCCSWNQGRNRPMVPGQDKPF